MRQLLRKVKKYHNVDKLTSSSGRDFRPFDGINTPLFSLKSNQSSGIGEFLDLKLFIDWLKPLKYNTIQLLPLNDSGLDPSPYNPSSANALNPIYISLEALPGIGNLNQLKKFNTTKHVHYQEVKQLKNEILINYVQKNRKEILAHPSYINFVNKHPWLQDFDVPYQMIQHIAYSQMEQVKAYAEKQGMFLMGDIPILVSRDSIEVKKHPHLFNLNLSAGAPPDYYSEEGQNWGSPLYNAEAMEKNHFQYWKQRLASASCLYHIYRLDHIVGFFRIWAIPEGKSAKEGHFVPEDPLKWPPQGEKMLTLLLQSSSMQPIGEDLGVIPKETRAVMHALGIPGTKVVFWERKWKEDKAFIPFSDYPKDSLTTLSTHDSESFPLFWQTHPHDAKAFAAMMGWEYEETLQKDQLFDLLKKSHHTPSLFHINLLQEYLNLTPELTWGNLNQERINIPNTISKNNWTYRYKCSIEEMASHTDLNTNLREILS